MVSGVTLRYDTNFLGAGIQSCSGISTPFNSTVQDIMNIASLYGVGHCSNNLVGYTAKYFEGFGNLLEHVLVKGLEWLPHTQNYNTSNEYWQLSMNGKVVENTGMSTTRVASKDLIEWKFVKANS